jgi:mannose-6-phosphate isomerase-like protein (cupin superfamily)
MQSVTFKEFEARKKAEGYDTVLERQWAANAMADTHTHPFDASALVIQGGFALTLNGQTHHLVPGSTFEVPRGTPHAEHYGPEGATFWVSRRGPVV